MSSSSETTVGFLDTSTIILFERLDIDDLPPEPLITTALYDVEGLVAGRDDLRPWEDEELGPLGGLDVVHLQCHIGTDTIALARRGARVVGLDFSKEAVSAARLLPDLRSWAQVVRGLLKPAGVLYLVELHPMWVAVIEDCTTICQDRSWRLVHPVG